MLLVAQLLAEPDTQTEKSNINTTKNIHKMGFLIFHYVTTYSLVLPNGMGKSVVLEYKYAKFDGEKLFLIIKEMDDKIENINFYVPHPLNNAVPDFSASATHTILGSEIVEYSSGTFDLKVTPKREFENKPIITVRISVPKAYCNKIDRYLFPLQQAALDEMWGPFEHLAAPEGEVHGAEGVLEQVPDDPPHGSAKGYSTVLRF